MHLLEEDPQNLPPRIRCSDACDPLTLETNHTVPGGCGGPGGQPGWPRGGPGMLGARPGVLGDCRDAESPGVQGMLRGLSAFPRMSGGPRDVLGAAPEVLQDVLGVPRWKLKGFFGGSRGARGSRGCCGMFLELLGDTSGGPGGCLGVPAMLRMNLRVPEGSRGCTWGFQECLDVPGRVRDAPGGPGRSGGCPRDAEDAFGGPRRVPEMLGDSPGGFGGAWGSQRC